MAEDQEDRASEDLSEEASPYRLEEFRQKGMVPQSRELTGILALLAAGVCAFAFSPKIGTEMAEYMREIFRVEMISRSDLGTGNNLHLLLIKAIRVIAGLALPVCIAGFLMGVVGSLAQVGSVFTFEPLTPNFEKINPLEGIKRLFSMKTVIEGLRLCLKMAAVSAVAYGLVKSEIFSSPIRIAQDPMILFSVFGHSSKLIFLSLIGVLSVFAAADYGLQRMEFGKKVRMTKQEAKQESKEREGDPQIKARIRGIQRDMARKRMMQAVKTADVIVTNPTHIAIAIVYDRKNMSAPKVVAKGADFVAQKIKQIAAEAGVPLVENVPLARTLYKTVKVNQFIPRALYQAVAEVLAYVYRLKRREFV